VISVGSLREACNYQRANNGAASAATRAAPATPAPPPPAPPPASTSLASGSSTGGSSRRARQDFDLDLAARLIGEVAMQTPNRGVSRATVERVVSRVPGFTKVPTKQAAAWLGCRDYEAMLRALAKIDPRLTVARLSGGGVQIRFAGQLPGPEGQEAGLG